MMSATMQSKLKTSLIRHEGERKFPYVDEVGKITVGIGYNMTDRGMTEEWIDSQYNRDVTFFYNQLIDTFPWFRDLNEDRQVILIDMCFMGWKHFITFDAMLSALSRRDYKGAAEEMLNSKWAEQTKLRAIELARGMESGVYIV